MIKSDLPTLYANMQINMHIIFHLQTPNVFVIFNGQRKPGKISHKSQGNKSQQKVIYTQNQIFIAKANDISFTRCPLIVPPGSESILEGPPQTFSDDSAVVGRQ